MYYCALLDNAEISLLLIFKDVSNPWLVPVHIKSANHVLELNTFMGSACQLLYRNTRFECKLPCISKERRNLLKVV